MSMTLHADTLKEHYAGGLGLAPTAPSKGTPAHKGRNDECPNNQSLRSRHNSPQTLTQIGQFRQLPPLSACSTKQCSEYWALLSTCHWPCWQLQGCRALAFHCKGVPAANLVHHLVHLPHSMQVLVCVQPPRSECPNAKFGTHTHTSLCPNSSASKVHAIYFQSPCHEVHVPTTVTARSQTTAHIPLCFHAKHPTRCSHPAHGCTACFPRCHPEHQAAKETCVFRAAAET